MPLEEDALGDSRILNSALDNVNGVIIEVVVKNALADSVVFVGVFHDWFLEVNFEVEHLKNGQLHLNFMS